METTVIPFWGWWGIEWTSMWRSPPHSDWCMRWDSINTGSHDWYFTPKEVPPYNLCQFTSPKKDHRQAASSHFWPLLQLCLFNHPTFASFLCPRLHVSAFIECLLHAKSYYERATEISVRTNACFVLLGESGSSKTTSSWNVSGFSYDLILPLLSLAAFAMSQSLPNAVL